VLARSPRSALQLAHLHYTSLNNWKVRTLKSENVILAKVFFLTTRTRRTTNPPLFCVDVKMGIMSVVVSCTTAMHVSKLLILRQKFPWVHISIETLPET
jgi:hypothetical protein